MWSAGFAYLGFAAGGAALRVLRIAHRVEVRLGLVALILAVVLVIILRRRLIAERTARVLGGERLSFATEESGAGIGEP